MRMTKDNFGADCKICLKPFTVFRWCPGKGMRFRRTEICQTCCKLKNTCQSCILDLQYGLPVQIRDGILQIKESCPQNEANREYFLASNSAKLARNDVTLIDYDKTDPAAKAILEQVSQKYSNTKTIELRNAPLVCSFYAKGACTRGSECPYKHILTTEKNSTSLKSYRDRYYGTDDPAAAAILEKNPELINTIDREGSAAAVHKPEDRTIKSLFVMGIRDGLTVEDIKEHFKAESIKPVTDGAAAIVSFKTRLDAEESAEDNLGMVDIKGVRVKVSWARSQTKTQEQKILKRVNETKETIYESGNQKEVEELETETKKIKVSKVPPPPPSSQNKPDYLSRHIGQLSNLK
jgi:pre-mRNA-splicing factor RBM22/SLT11